MYSDSGLSRINWLTNSSAAEESAEFYETVPIRVSMSALLTSAYIWNWMRNRLSRDEFYLVSTLPRDIITAK